MIHKLLYLISLNRNEALVATVLSTFRFEDDAGNTAGFPLLGGDVLSGDSSWDRVDSFVIFWVWSGESLQVGEFWWGLKFLKECSGGETPEVGNGGGAQCCYSADQHRDWGWFGVNEGFERGNYGLYNRLWVGTGVGRGRGHFGLLFGLIVRAFYSDEMG